MMDNKNDKGIASQIGQVMGVIVLAAASITGGWIACELWPKTETQMVAPPQMKPSVAVMPVTER